ncbi:MAG TPA: flagellin [Rhizomicrobium sp.]|nr:flagellin [Rhizomicrobium sp.]
MTIERTSTMGQSQYMLTLIQQASSNLNTTQAQVASGLVSTTYTGMNDKASLLQATQTAADKSNAYQANTALAVNQSDLQDTQLTTLSNLANSLTKALQDSVANNDATTLMSQAQSIFDQASQILNSTDANGNYIYAGDKDNTAPLTVSTLSQLAAAPTAASVFANGTQKKSVLVGDGQSVTVGMLASDIGTQLMSTLKDIATFDAGPTGNLSSASQLSQAQNDFLTTEIKPATDAATQINTQAASNGYVNNQLTNAVTNQQTMNTLYKTFQSSIQDVDMPTAISQLSQNQLALQAAIQVTAQLGNISLLNYLPKS